MTDTITTPWPRLRVADWTETRDTVHMWTQIVGKVRMAYAPPVNHWWHVTLYPTARGLTTSAVPYGDGIFDAEFDFVEHRLRIRTSDGRARDVALEPKPVATFYAETMDALSALGLEPQIHAAPNEVESAIPFAEDQTHCSYDGEAVQLFWRQLLQAQRVLGRFRAEFVGKASPVHFFWGAMDLAYTRFSGCLAPAHPGGAPNCPPWVMQEGYSHELASFGFWPGGGDEGAFYAYAYPEPAGYAERTAAYYDPDLRECVLPYEIVAGSDDPDATLLTFLRSTYTAAADLAGWDRPAVDLPR
ncbi:hypothetical protein Aab01nite_84320 [Paractinoplanes abujensis]|uniref:Ava_C0101 and related proteins n=1 Tax=Paractinoplanes abujensis TaxID=882441 RepID=A0A7W7G2C9_9ACTN|nr:DUF5996 family protein [Actinoplanes abujensis]MBB4693055.1 hypothetical protein [Actinoplanes abujensis]GID24842.1 hypothetical protein Aab01nite_84320 [Actinoplanes abujensis]